MILSFALLYSAVAQLNRPDGFFNHFELQLNGRHRVVFDTGSNVVWAVSPRLALGDYPCRNTKYSYGASSDDLYSVSTAWCRNGILRMSNELGWSGELRLAAQRPPWWTLDGILGADFNSAFSKRFGSFTITPGDGSYQLSVGKQRRSGQTCVEVPVTRNGVERGKWLIKTRMDAGGVTESHEFEVDTGFPPLAVTRRMFDAYVAKSGSRLEKSVGQYTHRLSACSKLPPVRYWLVNASGGEFHITVPATHFSTIRSDMTCEMHILVLEKNNFGFSYIGTPLLRFLSTTFNRQRTSVEFCGK